MSDSSECIILLTHRQKMGAEIFAVSRTGDLTRDRRDAKRFSRNQAERFVEQHANRETAGGVFRDYRMFIDPVVNRVPTPKPATTLTTIPAK